MTATRAGSRPAVRARAASAAAPESASEPRPSSGAAARPDRAPGARPRPKQAPPLRVVQAPDPERRARSRRRWFAGSLLGVAFVGMFAIVGLRVVLAQGQAEIDRLEADVAEAQEQSLSLRLDVARLESPSRIVNEAQKRLGMVPPPTVVQLAPPAPPAS